MPVNIDKLLETIRPDLPCGPDPADWAYNKYKELEFALPGKPGIVVDGKIIQRAEDPDWGALEKLCTDILSKSKDLRILTYFTVTLLCRQGYSGLRDGLYLLRYTVEHFWKDVYPLLDPEDGNDPTERRNILESLSPREDSVDEFLMIRKRLFDAPLCESRRFGRIGLREILVAAGELSLPADEDGRAIDANMILAAFKEMDTAAIQAQSHVVSESLEHLEAIEKAVQLHGVEAVPSLASLKVWLGRAAHELNDHLVRRGLSSTATKPVMESNPPGGASDAETPNPRSAIHGTIQNHDDVRRVLDQLCTYYERQEPSSPVPLLLIRARRLVGLRFTAIIRDLSPEALHQIELISGLPNNGIPNADEQH